MPQEHQPIDQPVPVLISALICDVACTDPSTGKTSLIGIFNRVFVGTFPTKRPMSLYVKVADADGDYDVEVRYVLLNSGDILAKAAGKLSATDRLGSTDIHIAFPPLPIPSEGRYEFQIWANLMYLGAAFLDAVQRPTATGGQ